jgi:hypothetical protein
MALTARSWDKHMKLYELDQLIKAVCPIEGVNTEGVIWFLPEATLEQRAAAQELMDEHLGSIEAWPL